MYKTIYRTELRKHFGLDFRRINHAEKVLDFAEIIMDGEAVTNDVRRIVTITALLHDIGIKIAEKKYNSASGHYQELEGPPIAREIMRQYNEPLSIQERVAYIIGGHHTKSKINGLDFQIIWEADLLVNIEEEGLANSTKIQQIINDNFRTITGKHIAETMYVVK